MLAEWVVRGLNRESCLLRHHKPCLLWLNAEGLLEWRCTERAALSKGIESGLLLEESGGRAAGSRVEYRCLFLLNCSEEVLHGLGVIGRFGGRTRGTRLGAAGSGFFRSHYGRLEYHYPWSRDELTWLGGFLGDSSRLSSVLPSFLGDPLVRLILDSVLFEMRVVQILFKRANEGHWCLFLWVRCGVYRDERRSDMFKVWNLHVKEIL